MHIIEKSLREFAILWGKRPPKCEIAQRAKPGEVGTNMRELPAHDSTVPRQAQGDPQ